ncbi:hypothetical protein SAMN05421503_2915 [Terribacillus aidingensis]|uniref:DUF4190 domain-containing protein n=1 Tax=Terribacillus aidingensis TaxID=586416 RepID=A0A285P8T2_9BACI|nr:hypothetical protein [Terribacillus aidingensis]SNZ16291.1 hypothetical protein SAMN05421503_2915 [Terribacillus aidingensis]
MKNRSLLSLVFGIISLFLSVYGIFFGIVGFILALHIIRKDRNTEGKEKKMAIGGLAASIIGAGYQIVGIAVILLTA